MRRVPIGPPAALAALLLLGCAPVARSSGALAPSVSPSRCRTGPESDSPLVTEWSASEKAHLEGLAAGQAVAVVFSGCELRVVDACRPGGAYVWRRTTLATDTVEIGSDDELWTKLPLGALGLEGELAKSGRLAVRTTVAGQLALSSFDPDALARDPACREVTHVIGSLSVGASELSSGGAMTARGAAGIAGLGAAAGARREEAQVRRAGDPATCARATDGAPFAGCAAPIQIFLRPVGAARAAAPSASEAAAVLVTFPAPADPGEHWTLRGASGERLCELPCTRPIGAGSGAYLERSEGNGYSLARVDVPARLPHAPRSHAVATYRAERGSPYLSSLTFYGLGVPSAVGGTILIGLAAGGMFKPDDPDRNDRTGFVLGAGAMYLGIAGATLGWWLWSHPAGIETRATVRVGPTGVSGSF